MKIFAMLLLATTFYACGPAKVKSNTNPVQDRERLLLVDRNYKSALRIVDEKVRRLESGQMEIIMRIQNRKNDDLWSDVQVIFEDADGVEVDKTNWEPVMFHRREITTYKKVSLTPNAQDYRVVIREAQTAR